MRRQTGHHVTGHKNRLLGNRIGPLGIDQKIGFLFANTEVVPHRRRVHGRAMPKRQGSAALETIALVAGADQAVDNLLNRRHRVRPGFIDPGIAFISTKQSVNNGINNPTYTTK